MNTRNLRGGLIAVLLVAVIVIGVLSFVGGLVSSILPLALTALIFFILGRLSVNYNLWNAIKSARAARPAQTTAVQPESKRAAPKAETRVEPARPAVKDEKTAQAAERLSDETKEAGVLLDPNFEIKTPEQIEAEARLREQEIAKRAGSATPDDIQAALEARRKRLLGDKGE